MRRRTPHGGRGAFAGREGCPAEIVVTLRGVDVYDPITDEIRSGGTDHIALSMIGTDYNGDALSRPFPVPSTGRIAVKVINDYGDEVMKVFEV